MDFAHQLLKLLEQKTIIIKCRTSIIGIQKKKGDFDFAIGFVIKNGTKYQNVDQIFCNYCSMVNTRHKLNK